jgi:transcriptional regulator with XRE-family HTH domain
MGTTLRAKIQSLSPERQAKIQAMADELISQEMTLRDLRQARQMTQVQVAQQLNIGQDAVSRMEKRTDLHISTLMEAIRAMGGELQLIVKFPDRPSVRLSGFQDLEDISLESATE